jgi:hypothetical protein
MARLTSASAEMATPASGRQRPRAGVAQSGDHHEAGSCIGHEQRADPADRVVARGELLDVHRGLTGDQQRAERVRGRQRLFSHGSET